MKAPFWSLVRCPSILGLLVCAPGSAFAAQALVELDARSYAGLSITGLVGAVYSIEYVTDLAQTTTPGAWRCLAYLQLPASPCSWADRSSPVTGRRFYRAVVMGCPTNMVFVPPGSFQMGSPTNEVDRSDREGPQTAVTITRGFWMGRCEVTQGEYLALLKNNPSFFTTNDLKGDPIAPDLNRPVESVSWFDATNYCRALTQRERAAGRIARNSVYRLPTEAEWEYACRGWTSSRFSFGEDPGYTNLGDYAWFEGNSSRTTHPVGQKLPNPWGLHDVHGNVWEWCLDWFSESLPGGIAIDPQGPVFGYYRVIRGGIWDFSAACCRSAYRNNRAPEGRYLHIGFRIVLAPDGL